MIIRSIASRVLILSLLFCLSGCGDKQEDTKKYRVVVGISPYADAVNKIVGDKIDVSILLPPNQSPETYELSPQKMMQLADADLYFCSGLPFEKKLKSKIASTFPDLEIVMLSEGLSVEPIRSEDEHSHHLDPHYWLSPKLYSEQLRKIIATLLGIYPEYEKSFDNNYLNMGKQYEALKYDLFKMLEPYQGRTIYVFHPAFGHFCADFGLHQVSIEEEGKDVTPQRLSELIDQARKDNVTTLFIQPQFSADEAKTMADALGCRLVKLNPIVEDYIKDMMVIGETVKNSFE